MKNCPVSAGRFSFHHGLLLVVILAAMAGAMSLLPDRERQGSRLSNTNRMANLPTLGRVPPQAASRTASPNQQQKLRSVFQQFPLGFEPNQGQTDPQVKFLVRGRGYGLFLTANEAVLKLQRSAPRTRRSASEASVVRMKLAGAKADAEARGVDELPGKSNYILGNDPSKWLLNVPQYARVRYHDVYPGVDLVYYGNQGQLEYDFEVAPGADPKVVQLSFDGSKRLVLDPKGNLVVRAQGGDVQLHAPVIYQQVGAEKRTIPGRFVLSAGNRVSFAIDSYDRSRTLIIDPVLTYSTYLGGSGNEGCSVITGAPTSGCPAVAVDSAFNFYVAGPTASTNFPLTPNPACPPPFQCTLGGSANLFVTKFNAIGGLVVSTYLGGNGTDTSAGIAVDSVGNVYVAGTTSSSNFPTTPNAFQPPPSPPDGHSHAFVSVLKPDLSGLVYSTYLSGDSTSGNSTDTATGLAIDNRGNAYVVGNTTSTNASPGFPATAGAFQTFSKAANQFFFSKISTTASGTSSLVYSTYLGGSLPASGVTVGGGIAVDVSGKVYITGGTDFTDLPVLNASQATSGGGQDAFVAKFDPTLSGLQGEIYLTYLGGNGDDVGNGIAVDAGGNAYVTGSTKSTNIVASATAFQSNNAGGMDAFVAKLNNPSSGPVSLTYFSYLGGSLDDRGLAIAVDANQITRVTGWTMSTDLHNSVGSLGPPVDAFFARIDTTGSANYVTYLGGSKNDAGTGIALDTNFNAYVAGDTNSPDFPPGTSSPPLQPCLDAPTAHPPCPSGLTAADAFIAKFVASSDLAITQVTPSVSPASVGNQVTFAFTVKNQGPDATTGVTFTDTLPGSGATFTSISTTLGNCGTPVGGTISCFLGTMASLNTATVNVVLVPTTPVAVPPGFSNTATVSAQPSINAPSIDPNPSNNTVSSTPIAVTDFGIAVNPSTAAVPAGTSATYQLMVTPLPTYTSNVSLSCSAGLPTGTKCNFSTNPVALANTSPVTSTLTISTTARPVSTGWLQRGSKLVYAVLLPVSGIAFLGFSRFRPPRRRWLGVLFVAAVVGLLTFQMACGSSSKPPPITGGTPAGTYAITVTGTSGSVSHGATTTLVVE